MRKFAKRHGGFRISQHMGSLNLQGINEVMCKAREYATRQNMPGWYSTIRQIYRDITSVFGSTDDLVNIKIKLDEIEKIFRTNTFVENGKNVIEVEKDDYLYIKKTLEECEIKLKNIMLLSGMLYGEISDEETDWIDDMLPEEDTDLINDFSDVINKTIDENKKEFDEDTSP